MLLILVERTGESSKSSSGAVTQECDLMMFKLALIKFSIGSIGIDLRCSIST